VSWPLAGFSVWYQVSDSWVGLVAFGVPIAVMTAALHAGVRIRYLPEVSECCQMARGCVAAAARCHMMFRS
jgi:hypothetical protein